jgi:protein tyrosine/serine phosphatase
VSLANFPVEALPAAVDTIKIRPVGRIVSIVSYTKRAAVILGSILSVSLGWAGLFLATLHMGDNFHAVVPGELYRSAQPTAVLIAEYKENYAIKTIINLRGDNTGSGWYDSEVAEARKLGIAHVDFRMSARRELTMEQFNQLMDVFQKAEKPILVHCMSGADRSGLVSALYVAAVAKLGEQAAESQISFRYGHIPLPISAPYAMDRSFEAFEEVLGFPKS